MYIILLLLFIIIIFLLYKNNNNNDNNKILLEILKNPFLSSSVSNISIKKINEDDMEECVSHVHLSKKVGNPHNININKIKDDNLNNLKKKVITML